MLSSIQPAVQTDVASCSHFAASAFVLEACRRFPHGRQEPVPVGVGFRFIIQGSSADSKHFTPHPTGLNKIGDRFGIVAGFLFQRCAHIQQKSEIDPAVIDLLQIKPFSWTPTFSQYPRS